MDNARNNNTFAVALEEMLIEEGIGGAFTFGQHRLRCLAHVINLVAKAGLEHPCLSEIVEKV